MSKRPWIDVSVLITPELPVWAGDPPVTLHPAMRIQKGAVCNVTHIHCSVHVGTHMDGLCHFIDGAPGLETMPIDATIGPCRVIEIKDKESIKPSSLQRLRLRKGERVLFKTINSKRCWQQQHFVKDFVYIAKEAAQYLVDRGVRTVGIDYLSIGGFYQDGVETHQIMLGAGIWVIEGLNLSAIKPGRYDLICLPVKIAGSDGAPARAVLRARN